MILTLVGISYGTLDETARRARGVGADILVRPPAGSMEVIDYLAEELKKSEPVVDYLAEELKREQQKREAKLIRPTAKYVGPPPRPLSDLID